MTRAVGPARILTAAGLALAVGAAAVLSARSAATHQRERTRQSAARLLNGGAAILAASVLADSTLEHHRARFYNRVMYVAPAISALTLLAAVDAAVRPGRYRVARSTVFLAAAATGLVGTGFHVHNQLRKEGGLSWNNLFYAAPIAAPMGAHLAGLAGLAGIHVVGSGAQRGTGRRAQLQDGRIGPLLGALASIGLLGTAAEAWLLHFRGAFQDPFMYLPVTVPPAAAAGLGWAVTTRDARSRQAAKHLLQGTLAVGLAGSGFHALGIHRSMGGWRNWSQNILAGPPLPAPPAFTGLALVGLAALRLLENSDDV